MRRRAHRQGFTLIEVMVSLGVMTMGAMAIITLQQRAIAANNHAREVTTATLIAERWVERLHQDAHTWNRPIDPNVAGDDLVVLGNTTWLQTIIGLPNFTNYLPLAPTNFTSPGFTRLGRDSVDPDAAGPVVYCSAYRLSWVLYGRALRADVRVWWTKLPPDPAIGFVDINSAQEFAGCDGNHSSLDPGGQRIDSYHVVYVPAVIRMNPVDR